MRTDIPFSQKPYSSPLTSLGAEVCNNFYVELSTSETSRSKYYYVGIPGLRLLRASSSSVFSAGSACRGLWTTSGGLTYGVYGRYLVQLQYARTTSAPSVSYTLVGELRTASGVVRFVDNGDILLLVDGKYAYTVHTADNVYAQVTEEGFPGALDGVDGPTHCACVDTYFIVNSSNTNKYYWSAPGYIPYAFDSTHPSVLTLWNALDYGEKIGDSDYIVGMQQTVGLLWLFGKRSIEIHRNVSAGDDASGQQFGRMDNAFINFGCYAPSTICRYGNTVYWIGADNTGTLGVFSADSSFQPTRVSTRGVETRLQKYTRIDDAYSFVYSMDGHAFIVFQFPSGTPTDDQYQATGATWVYDITSGTWTRRTRWYEETGLSGMWPASFATYNWSTPIFGDRSTNATYWLDNQYFENDNPDGVGTNMIERIVTSPVGNNAARNVVYHAVQLQMQPGQGLVNPNAQGIGTDPEVMYSYANDGGFSWSNERHKSFGMIGEYAYRCRWVKCGHGRNRVHKFRITAPVFVAIIGLNVDIETLSA